jgi:hypothetical protein
MGSVTAFTIRALSLHLPAAGNLRKLNIRTYVQVNSWPGLSACALQPAAERISPGTCPHVVQTFGLRAELYTNLKLTPACQSKCKALIGSDKGFAFVAVTTGS